jgi:hypothetical protein
MEDGGEHLAAALGRLADRHDLLAPLQAAPPDATRSQSPHEACCADRAALQAFATLLLGRLEEAWGRFPEDWADTYQDLIWAALLELAGRQTEADVLVAESEERSIPRRGYCRNTARRWDGNPVWLTPLTTRRILLHYRKALVAERRGDHLLALRHLIIYTQCFRAGHLLTTDYVFPAVRISRLLLKLGRTEDGLALLQATVDLHPKAVGVDVARTLLTQHGTLIEPTEERLTSVYLHGLPSEHPWRTQALTALTELPAITPR